MLSCWFEQFLLQPWVDMLHHFSDTSSLAVFEDAALFQDRGLGHSTLLYAFTRQEGYLLCSQFGPATCNSGPSLKTEDLHRSRVDDRLPPRDFEEITEVVRNDLKIVRGPENLRAAGGRLRDTEKESLRSLRSFLILLGYDNYAGLLI